MPKFCLIKMRSIYENSKKKLFILEGVDRQRAYHLGGDSDITRSVQWVLRVRQYEIKKKARLG